VLTTDIPSPAVPATTLAHARAALIVPNGPGRRIAESLEGLGVEITAFDGIEELLDDPDKLELSAILVWAQDTHSAPATLIVPLARRFAQTPIVVVCADIERWEMRAVLAAGASGVVLADNLDAAMRPCLEAVRSGQVCVPRGHWRQIQPPALSSREKQILGLLVMGYMNSQIAAELFLAESTVKSHLSSAFGKLGVRSRNEAVSLILDPERGLGVGILTLGGEPVEQPPTR
jgi:DNA-binding NarL/FixJ family response regulator